MSDINIKQVIKQEYINCAKDPAHFMKKYCLIQHPQEGKIPFNLYSFQEKCLTDFLEHDYNIILKSRQLGLSTLTAGYSLWLMTFHTDKNILVIATKQDTAKNLVTKVRVMHANLPQWLKSVCIEDNKLSLRYKNGSQIKAVASSEDAGRSEALSLLILDEVAFIDKIDDIWAAAQQTLATGGRCLALSTPNGVGNWFHKIWVDAEEGNSDWNFTKLHWSMHPDRDQKWRDKQDIKLGPEIAAQECDCDFITSGRTVIEGILLEEIRTTTICDPIEKRGTDGNLWIWEQPNYDRTYVMSADVARGDGEDFSAFHIFDVDKVEQVAEYKGKVSPKDFGNLCVNVATEYNNALMIIENSNIGWAALQQVIDRGYDNLFYTSKDLQYVDTQHQINNKINRTERNMIPGFSTTVKTRPMIIAKLEEYFRGKDITVHSSRLIDELFVFIWHNAKAEAMQGYNDDLVMSLAIGLWIRDTALRLKAEGNELQKKVLDGMLLHEAVYSGHEEKNDSWEMDVGNEKEDLTWLIK